MSFRSLDFNEDGYLSKGDLKKTIQCLTKGQAEADELKLICEKVKLSF